MKHSKSLYSNIINIDEATGLPANYDSLFAGYDSLVKAAASRKGIPVQDVEDAAQEVSFKFWQKNGLDFYDPEQKTKFASLYRSWTGMFMLQERDKVIKWQDRNLCVDANETTEQFDGATEDFSEDFTASEAVVSWVREAEKALADKGKAHLIPLLYKCVEAAELNTTVSRADIVEALGCTLNQATARLQELRKALVDSNMGADSLW